MRFFAVIAAAVTAALISAAAISAPHAADAAAIPNAITSVSPTTTEPVAHGDKLTFEGTWAVPDHSNAGDTFTLQLPSQLKWYGAVDFNLTDRSGNVVATAHAESSGHVVFTLTDYVTTHPNDVHGTFQFITQYTAEQTKPGSEQLVFLINGTTKIPTEITDKGPGSGTPGGPTVPGTIKTPFKWVSWGDIATQKMIKSFLSSPTLTTPASTVTITDTPQVGMALDCTSVTPAVGDTIGNGWQVVDDLSATHPATVNCSSSKLTVTWTNLPAGATAQVRVNAAVTDSTLQTYINSGAVVIDNKTTPVTATVKREGASGTGTGEASSTPTPTPTRPASSHTTSTPTPTPKTPAKHHQTPKIPKVERPVVSG